MGVDSGGEEKSFDLLEHYLFTQREGGLGFRSLRMVNSAYLMKLGWEIISKKDALWA